MVPRELTHTDKELHHLSTFFFLSHWLYRNSHSNNVHLTQTKLHVLEIGAFQISYLRLPHSTCHTSTIDSSKIIETCITYCWTAGATVQFFVSLIHHDSFVHWVTHPLCLVAIRGGVQCVFFAYFQ